MSDDLKVVLVPRELYYHEVAYVRGLEVDNKRLREAVKGLLIEWDRLTKYGSPLAKAANDRVVAARAALERKL
jgi:hypothetical protein